MSKSTFGLRKAGIASIATTALVMGAGFAGAGTASALPGFEFDREAGADRYATAADIATSFDATEDVTSVILASGQEGRFPDALSANYLGGELNAPILLTRLNDMPASTRTALESLGSPANIDIKVVGGDGVISDAQVASLRNDGYDVQRHSGPVRYDTNAEVIEAGGTTADTLGIIASGENFPDALAAGPVAFSEGYALGLTKMNDVPNQVIAALKGANVDRAVIVGGAGVVSQAVVDELEAKGIDVIDRLSGPNRDDTAAEVATWALTLGFSDTEVSVASGYNDGGGADALAGGPLSGAMGWPMLITRNVDVPGSGTLGWLSDNCPTLTDGVIYGGTGAVSAGAEAEMVEAASNCGASNQDFTVDQAAATNDFSTAGTSTATDDRGRRTYSFSGLDDTKTYDVAVYPAEYVTVDSSGAATFRDTEGTTVTTDDNNVADFEETSAVIERINNAPYTDGATNGTAMDQSPVNGVITVTIDSTSVDEVRPVLFLDADNGSTETLPDLDLDAQNQPTELFAVGGEKTWVAPASASTADGADGRVVSLDKTANRFSVDSDVLTAGDYDAADADVTYLYDGNDTYSLNDVPATFDEFEAALSRGDFVEVGNYSTNPALVSQFDIETDTPGAPTTVVATAGVTGQSTNDITVAIDPSTPNDPTLYDSFVIQRATVVGGTPGTYTTVKTLTPAEDADASATTISWVDTDVAPGIYQYRAAGVIDGDQGPYTESAPATSVAPGADTTGPQSDDAVVTTNSGLGGTFDAGDVFKVVFNETMAAPNSGDTIRAEDGDGTVADFINGTNATFSLNTAAETVNGESQPAGTVLTVTLTTAPAVVTAGSAVGLQIPATVTDQSGNTDAAGNGWDIAGSADKLLDQDSVDNTP